jgi:hypothetical protein
MLEQVCVDNAGVDGMNLNFQSFLQNQSVQVLREVNLSQLAVAVCVDGEVIFPEKRILRFVCIFLDGSHSLAVEVIVVHVASKVTARRNVDDSGVPPVIGIRASDELRHQQMSEQEVSCVVDSHLGFKAVFRLFVRRRHYAR